MNVAAYAGIEKSRKMPRGWSYRVLWKGGHACEIEAIFRSDGKRNFRAAGYSEKDALKTAARAIKEGRR